MLVVSTLRHTLNFSLNAFGGRTVDRVCGASELFNVGMLVICQHPNVLNVSLLSQALVHNIAVAVSLFVVCSTVSRVHVYGAIYTHNYTQ